jgi:hypothetical protein
MNYFNEYNPLVAMQGGMNLFGGMMNQYDNARARELSDVQRNALAQMGKGDQLAGFEDNPMAIRPDFAKQAYASGNPQLAMWAEQQASAPYLVDREAKRSGDIERAKLKAREDQDSAMWSNMPGRVAELMRSVRGGSPSSAGSNVFASQQWAPPAATELGLPQAPGSGVLAQQQGFAPLGRALSGNGMDQLDSSQVDVTIDEHGRPQLKLKSPDMISDERLRRQSAVEAMNAETNQGELSERKARNSATQADESSQRIAQLIEQRRELLSSGTKIPPHIIAQNIGEIDKEIELARTRRAGSGPMQASPLASQAQLTPQEKQMASQARSARSAVGKSANSQSGESSGLPWELEVSKKAKTQQRQTEMTQDTIESMHAERRKFAATEAPINKLFDLLATKEVGSPKYKFVPFGAGPELAAFAHADNEQLVTLGKVILDAFKPENASKTMDTLPELRIIASQIPNEETRHSLNRELMANVMNKFSGAMVAPKFLDQWSRDNKESLTGAREMFSEWLRNNPAAITENVNGDTVLKRQVQIPIENWVKLRKKFSEEDIMKKRKEQGF